MVESLRPRRNQLLPQRFRGSVVTESVGGSSRPTDEYHTHIYYALLDVVMAEMEQRLSEMKLSLLGAMQALLPTSEKFLDIDTLLPLLVHYEIDVEQICVEALTAQRFLREPQTCDKLKFLHHVYSEIQQVSECFPQLLKTL